MRLFSFVLSATLLTTGAAFASGAAAPYPQWKPVPGLSAGVAALLPVAGDSTRRDHGAQVVPQPPGTGNDVPEEMDPGVEPPPAPAVPPVAEDPSEEGKAVEEADAELDLDTLFKQLAEAKSDAQRKRLATTIQVRWSRSESPTIDLLMLRARAAMQNKAPGLALDLLDAVVRYKPDFIAGWNRRAAANFLAGDLGKALVDVERTLALEPRHWGALAGLAAIQQAVGRETEAIATYRKILDIYPGMEQAAKGIERLEEKTRGRDL